MTPDTAAYVESILKLATALIGLVGILVTARTSRRDSSGSLVADLKSVFDGIRRSNLPADVKDNIESQLTQLINRMGSLQKWLRLFVVLFVLILGTAVALFALQPHGRAALSRYLSRHDPAIFSGSRTGTYDIARLIANRSDLEAETDLSATLDDTQQSFDLMTTGGGVIHAYLDDLRKAIERGVRVRIVLLDPGPATEAFYDATLAIGRDEPLRLEREKAIASEQMIQNMQEEIRADPGRFKGSLELRWLQIPMIKLMWLKDSATANAIVHLTVPVYHDSTRKPSFRVSKDGGSFINSTREEFEVIWRNSATSRSK